VLLSDFLVYLEEAVAKGVYNDGREDIFWCSFGIHLAQVSKLDALTAQDELSSFWENENFGAVAIDLYSDC